MPNESLQDINLIQNIGECSLDRTLLDGALWEGEAVVDILGGSFEREEGVSKPLADWLERYPWVPARSQKNKIYPRDYTFAWSVFLNPHAMKWVETIGEEKGTKAMDAIFDQGFCSLSDHLMRLLSHYNPTTGVDNEAMTNYAVALMDYVAQNEGTARAILEKGIPPLMLLDDCTVDPSKIFWAVAPYLHKALVDKGVDPLIAVEATLLWSSARKVVQENIDADFPGLVGLRKEYMQGGGWYMGRTSNSPSNRLSANLGSQLANKLLPLMGNRPPPKDD